MIHKRLNTKIFIPKANDSWYCTDFLKIDDLELLLRGGIKFGNLVPGLRMQSSSACAQEGKLERIFTALNGTIARFLCSSTKLGLSVPDRCSCRAHRISGVRRVPSIEENGPVCGRFANSFPKCGRCSFSDSGYCRRAIAEFGF